MEPNDSAKRRGLPLRFFDSRPAGESIPSKCIYKCGAACYHEAPNQAGMQARQDESLSSIITRRFSRRTLFKGAAAAAVPMVLAGTPVGGAILGEGSPVAPRRAAAAVPGRSLGFTPITLGLRDEFSVPSGYTYEVLLRWGDPLFEGTPRLTGENATPALQAQTFGYNCDLNAYFPLPYGSGSSTHGLLCVNHEYTEGPRMFPDYDPEAPTRAQVDVELEAHGMSVVELRRAGKWGVHASAYTRRITATTPMEITGPLAGDPRMRTSDDRRGHEVLGMLNNCAGGKTPWGTVLTAEENFHQYFANNDAVRDDTQRAMNARYGVPAGESERKWERFYDRFDVSKEPNEVNRFGYLVEIDPYDPDSTPKKRTALGRFKHEAGSIVISKDGRVVVYSGDDERFDYLYKFVSRRRYNPNSRLANKKLLDEGTLYVAKFSDDGTGAWIPLTPETLPGWSEADIALYTRGAGDAVRATPMDRPEDVEVNPLNNKVYVALTNNTNREASDINGMNPRGPNRDGHVIEILEAGGDMAATTFAWEVFLVCGEPSDPSTFYAGFDKDEVSAIACPDNLAFDHIGNVWIATDGQPGTIKKNDTVFAVPTAGPDRGKVQPFLSVPPGAEVCGPEFTPDGQTLFVNVQHPGEDSEGPEAPQTLWPDGVWPPLPSLVVVTKIGGGRIGS